MQIQCTLFRTGLLFSTGIVLSGLMTVIYTGLQADTNMGMQESSFESLTYLTCAAVVFPLVEEAVFRSVIFNKLLTEKIGLNTVFAGILSSLLFAAAHRPIEVAFAAFFIGFILCLFYKVGGALPASFAVHFSFNAFSIISAIRPLYCSLALFAAALIYIAVYIKINNKLFIDIGREVKKCLSI